MMPVHRCFVRDAESKFTLANTMRMHLYSALAALKSGMDLMLKEEGVQVDQLFGHGGYFKTKGVGQRIAAAAMNAPVSVMETAGEAVPGVLLFWLHSLLRRRTARAWRVLE